MASQPPSNPYQFDSQTPYAAVPQVQTSEKPKAIKVLNTQRHFWRTGTARYLYRLRCNPSHYIRPHPSSRRAVKSRICDTGWKCISVFLQHNICSSRTTFCYCLTCQRHWFIETQEVGANYGFGMGRLLRPLNDRSLGRNMDTPLPLSTGNVS